MDDKARYVERKFKQVLIPFGIAFLLALSFAVFAVGASILGDPTFVNMDLFKFSLVVSGFGVPFFGFLYLVRAIVLSGISSSSK